MLRDVRNALRPIVWLGDSLRALRSFPARVQAELAELRAKDEVGYVLFLAQTGEKHVDAKPMKGLGPGVLEVVSDHRGDTFGGVYTVRLADRLFVLHALQKKSKHGSATPQADIELVRRRLKQALEIDAQE